MHDSDVSRYQAGAREMATDWTELNELAVSLAWADDWGERAFEVNSKIITLDRCCTAALNRLARCYLCANNPDAARATYERVLLIDPENRIAINGRKSLVGNRLGEVEAGIAAATPLAGPAVSLADGRLEIAAAEAPGPADVWLVRYDPNVVEVPIARGENTGRTLPHTHAHRP